eukprot:CAMPEP_0172518594 /NCGR_PEP_ID=MMETSP1066-20121228/290913_1 /TAXON_ID=671091 /ORGANISM="Coscinodiscus wailesii, Strain CCMP2513" /LENGTH=1241 /DNA_ID=CAMNT_0013301019 /DNA_START=249 /DNA_END=3975 /DNA_ORIENTATION=-
MSATQRDSAKENSAAISLPLPTVQDDDDDSFASATSQEHRSSILVNKADIEEALNGKINVPENDQNHDTIGASNDDGFQINSKVSKAEVAAEVTTHENSSDCIPENVQIDANASSTKSTITAERTNDEFGVDPSRPTLDRATSFNRSYGGGHGNDPHDLLEYPPLYFFMKRWFPNSLEGLNRIYDVRWGMTYPFQRRFPMFRKLYKYGFVFSYGEVLLVLPFFAFFIMGLVTSFANPSVALSGEYARLPLIFAYLTANHNSLVTLLVGIPFERAIRYHKIAGRLAFVNGIFHTVVAFAPPRAEESGSVHTRIGASPNFGLFLFDGSVNAGGSMLFILCFMMTLTSIPYIRHRIFEFFYYLHVLFALVMTGCAFYHSGVLVPILVSLLWGGDLIIRKLIMAGYRYPHEANIKNLTRDVIELSIPKTEGFDYNPGQYMSLCVPKVSLFQWHPFSISSSPHQDEVTFHIRKRGKWTKALHKYAESNDTVTVLMEGPYGSLSVDLISERYKMMMLLSGGIGVTPMQSICHQLMHEHEQYGRELKKIWFVWTARDPEILDNMDVSIHGSSRHMSMGNSSRFMSMQDSSRMYNTSTRGGSTRGFNTQGSSMRGIIKTSNDNFGTGGDLIEKLGSGLGRKALTDYSKKTKVNTKKLARRLLTDMPQSFMTDHQLEEDIPLEEFFDPEEEEFHDALEELPSIHGSSRHLSMGNSSRFMSMQDSSRMYNSSMRGGSTRGFNMQGSSRRGILKTSNDTFGTGGELIEKLGSGRKALTDYSKNSKVDTKKLARRLLIDMPQSFVTDHQLEVDISLKEFCDLEEEEFHDALKELPKQQSDSSLGQKFSGPCGIFLKNRSIKDPPPDHQLEEDIPLEEFFDPEEEEFHDALEELPQQRSNSSLGEKLSTSVLEIFEKPIRRRSSISRSSNNDIELTAMERGVARHNTNNGNVEYEEPKSVAFAKNHEEIELTTEVEDILSLEFFLTKQDKLKKRSVLNPFVSNGRPDIKKKFLDMRKEAIEYGEKRIAVCVRAPQRLVDICKNAKKLARRLLTDMPQSFVTDHELEEDIPLEEFFDPEEEEFHDALEELPRPQRRRSSITEKIGAFRRASLKESLSSIQEEIFEKQKRRTSTNAKIASKDIELTSSKKVSFTMTDVEIPEPPPVPIEDILSLEFFLTKKDNPKKRSVLNPFVSNGRPDIKKKFLEMRKEAIENGEKRIAVCVCAPQRLVDICKNACAKFSNSKVRFDFHSEVFD